MVSEINLKDIRVGNYVHHRDDWSYRQVGIDFKEFDFAWDYSDFHALLECTLFPEAIEYISLTEEWLLNFGFKKSGYEFLFWEHPQLKSVDFAGINWADEDFPEYQFLNVSINGHIIQINYVHQLQNFYFTLTGEDLVLKKI